MRAPPDRKETTPVGPSGARESGGVTLQISLAPSDAHMAGQLLDHQMRQCGRYADEVLLTLDLELVGRSYEFGRAWEANTETILAVVQEAQASYGNVRLVKVDPSPGARRAVAERFFGGRTVPRADYRGRPFYAYFFGLYAASHDKVFHLDADMLLGGGSPTWFDEAARLLADRPDTLTCSPLPGPPTATFELTTQRGDPVAGLRAAFAFPNFSSRVFFLDRRCLEENYHPPRLILPERLRDIPRAYLHGRPMVGTAEGSIGRVMARSGLWRIDFLGEGPGLWSLHPPYRSETFYRRLPEIIAMVEEDSVPDGQRGAYDLNDSIIDWSDARAELRASRWRR